MHYNNNNNNTEPDSRTRGCETYSRTSRTSSGKILYEPATEPDGAHRRWLREAPDHWCCLRGLVCCLRHGQPPTPPQQDARDDWRRTTDRPDTQHAGQQTLLRGAEREEEPLATTTKRTTTGMCTGTDVVPTSTPTTSPYTPTQTTSKRHSRLPWALWPPTTRLTNCVWSLQRHRCVLST